MKKLIAIITALCMLLTLGSLVSIVAENDELPTDDWTFDASSINANSGVPLEVPEKVIDGDPQSHWHSMINPKAEAPHFITIILPKEAEISGLRYTPRADGGAGIFTEINLYGSLDGKKFYLLSTATWAEDTEVKTVLLSSNVKVKYVKLEATKAKDGYGSAGEIRLVKPNTKNKAVALDAFKATKTEAPEAPVTPVISKSGMTAVASSEQPSCEGSKVLDGSIPSLWHSKFDQAADSDKLPITLTIDMGAKYTIGGIIYYPRSDDTVGYILNANVSVSLDGKSFTQWGTIKNTEADVSKDKKEYAFKATDAKYIKIEITDGYKGYAAMGELDILRPDASKPATEEEKPAAEKPAYERYDLFIGKSEINAQIGENKSTIQLAVAPMINNGRTMIPLRGLFEAMNAKVDWNGDLRQITITKGETVILFTIDSTTAYINGVAYTIDASPMIVNGSTLIPIRFISENLKYNVAWEPTTQNVTIEINK